MKLVVESFRYFDGPVVVDLHVSGIASKVFTIKIHSIVTHVRVLQLRLAVSAVQISVSDRAYTDDIPNFKSMSFSSNLGDLSYNLMSSAAREELWTYMM